jgi:hypothetical protein
MTGRAIRRNPLVDHGRVATGLRVRIWPGPAGRAPNAAHLAAQQSDEVGFETVPQPGFQHLSGYVEFWL